MKLILINFKLFIFGNCSKNENMYLYYNHLEVFTAVLVLDPDFLAVIIKYNFCQFLNYYNALEHTH